MRQPFAVLRDGRVVGSTSYMSLAPEHLRLEIGNTWMNPSTWGTGANVEAKYLLLRHAFEVVGCRRVEFKTDALNERARAALAALPAEFEGIHRKHMIVRDGERRDSAWYAVIDDDWPARPDRARASSGGQELDCDRPGIRYGTGAKDGRKRECHRSRPRRLGARRPARGARHPARRAGCRAHAPVRSGRGHPGRGPGTVPRTRPLDRPRQRRHAALGARPARAALLLHPLQTFTRARGPEQLDGAWAAVTAETDEARERSASSSRASSASSRSSSPTRPGRSTTPAPRSPRTTSSRCTASHRDLLDGRRRAARGARAADATDDRERLRADRPDRARRLGDGRGPPRGDPQRPPDLEPLYDVLAEATAR